MMKLFVSCVLLTTLFFCADGAQESAPLWKVFTQPTPIYRGRADPIVFPGAYSQHAHKVFGGNNFAMFTPQDSPLSVYKTLFSSTCTTASLTIDKSNYWIPDLYYQWPNKSFSLVPQGGLTAYYEARTGNGDQAHPKWQAFPPGFRMIAGNPYRRSFNASVVAETAMSYACLSTVASKETQYFPTDKMFCNNGLRTQVYFPMCWDGVNLDTPTHSSHVAYPTRYNNGDCPATHPVRLPGLFYEVLYSVDQFPHGTGTQPFVWACGDPTGYGLHGDFLNGWDTQKMQAALEDVSCFANNTANGNNVANCKTFAPYLKSSNSDMTCLLSNPINNYEDLGINHLISHLPGCNPVDHGPDTVNFCTGSWPVEIMSPGVKRVLIKSMKNNKYVSARSQTIPLTADTTSGIFVPHVFELILLEKSDYILQSEMTREYLTLSNNQSAIFANGRSYNPPRDLDEKWLVTFQGGTGPTLQGTQASIKSYGNDKYLVTAANGELVATGTTEEYFIFIDANAGVPDTRSKKW